MNLFKSVKSFIVEAYTVLCVSTAAPEVVASIAAPVEVVEVTTPSPAVVSAPAGALVSSPAGTLVSTASPAVLSEAAGTLVSSPAGVLVSAPVVIEALVAAAVLVALQIKESEPEVSEPASEAVVSVTVEVLEVYSMPVAPAHAVVYEEGEAETVLHMVEGGNYFLAVEENRLLVQEMLAQQEKKVQSKVRWAKAKAYAAMKTVERKAQAEAKAKAEADALKAKADALNATPEAIAGKQSYAAALAWVSALKIEVKDKYEFCKNLESWSKGDGFEEALEAIEYARYKLEAAEVVLASFLA